MSVPDEVLGKMPGTMLDSVPVVTWNMDMVVFPRRTLAQLILGSKTQLLTAEAN